MKQRLQFSLSIDPNEALVMMGPFKKASIQLMITKVNEYEVNDLANN